MTRRDDVEQRFSCPQCDGKGMAWQYRRYGNEQYHGEYYETCDSCGGSGCVDITAATPRREG